EEELHLPVLREGVGELAELVVDRVELSLVLGGAEQSVRVDASDLLHYVRSPLPSRVEKSTSERASSISFLWSSAVRDLRATFSVVSTVRSATSLRICSSERRVSASMSRLAASTSSSRFSLPSSVASCLVVSAAFRARATMSSACSRASF